MKRNLFVLALSLALFACHRFTARAPEGFATFKGSNPFRAVSPEGLLYRVHAVTSEEKADIGFWKEAMKQRMLDAGYHFMNESDFASERGTPGYMIELTAPAGDEDDTYLIAVLVKDNKVVVAEASGEVSHFQTRHDAITAAVKAIEF